MMSLMNRKTEPDLAPIDEVSRSPLSTLNLAALLALCIATSTAIAQESGGATGAAQGSGGATRGALEEVVVTAQFRSQDLQQTPLAISAVTASMIEERGQASVQEVASRAPSVTFTSGGLGGSQTTAINIRGVGQTDFNLAVEPGVGMYIDDVYHGTVYGSMLELLDLDRVEVLRGPQGTLSGKNSEGGSVKLFSKQPSADSNGYLQGTFGSYNRRQLRAGDSFTIIPDKLFVRLTGMGEKSEGYVTRYDYQCRTGQSPTPNNLNYPAFNAGSLAYGSVYGCKLGTEGGRDVTALRAAIRYVASDRIEDTLTYDTTVDHSEPPPTVLIYQGTWHGPGFGPGNPNLAANFVPPAGSYYNYATYTGLVGTPYQYTLPATSDLNAWGISNVLDIKLTDTLSLKSISATRHITQNSVSDADASPLARIMNLWNLDYDQWTQELRLNGSFGKLIDWTLGGFYFKSDSRQGSRISLDGASDNAAPVFLTTDFIGDDPVTVESKSAFAHAEFHATDALTFTGGLRYTDDFKRYTFGRATAPGYPPSPIDLSIIPTNGLSGDFSGSRWDYRVTAAYQFTPDLNIYAQYATGFKGGGVNPRPYYPQQVRPFNPETVKSYEVGVKSDLLDNHVRVNVAAFYNKYNDMQLTLSVCPQFVPAGAPQNCALPANVGNSTIKGAEIETEMRLIEGLLIDASASYIDFQYDNVDPITTGIFKGFKTPFTPKEKYAAGVQYEIPLGDSGSLTPRVDYRYQAETYANPINAPRNRIPSFGLTNAHLTYKDSSGNWEVALIGTNLFNKYYYLNVLDQSPPLNFTYQMASVNPGRPREYALSVKRSF